MRLVCQCQCHDLARVVLGSQFTHYVRPRSGRLLDLGRCIYGVEDPTEIWLILMTNIPFEIINGDTGTWSSMTTPLQITILPLTVIVGAPFRSSRFKIYSRLLHLRKLDAAMPEQGRGQPEVGTN